MEKNKKYLHYYTTSSDKENDMLSTNYIEPWVSAVVEQSTVKEINFNIDQNHEPFTIEALSSGTIKWDLNTISVQYSKNGGNWTTMNSGTTISVVAGDRVRFKSNNSKISTTTTEEEWDDDDEEWYDVTVYHGMMKITANFNVMGNIMSLTNGDDYENADSLAPSAFTYLFSACTTLRSAEKLYLPIKDLSNSSRCYWGMFNGCTGLTSAPELPATILSEGCYAYMFNNCKSLTTAPVLPANNVFVSPTGMGPYSMLFQGCSNLTYIKALFTKGGDTLDLFYWVNGVSPSGTFVKHVDCKLTATGKSAIPSGWTVETARR